MHHRLRWKVKQVVVPPLNLYLECPRDFRQLKWGSGFSCFKNIGHQHFSQGARLCREEGASLPLPKNEEENNAFKAVGGLLDATDLDFDGVWKDSFGNVVNYFGPFTSWSKDEGYYMNGVADSGEWSKSKNVGC